MTDRRLRRFEGVADSTPRTFRSGRDAVSQAVRVLAAAPHLLRAYLGGIDPALRERLMTAVSRTNSCASCSRVHEGCALRAGVTSEELAAIRLGELSALDETSRAAVVLVVALADHRFERPAEPDVERAARAHLSLAAMRQLEALARAMTFANLALNTLRAGRQRMATKGAHPVFALVWRLLGPRAVASSDRAALVDGLSGTVVELGAGDGANFAHYPAAVAAVVAIEPEPNLRGRAASRAKRSQVPVEVRDATAEAIPLEDGSCDAVVACLVLCSVTDQHRVLAEVRRVLRPGGELRFYEHVVSERPRVADLQRFLDRTGLWPKLGAGCHLSRDTDAVMEQAGFTIAERWPIGIGGLRIVAGVARP